MADDETPEPTDEPEEYGHEPDSDADDSEEETPLEDALEEDGPAETDFYENLAELLDSTEESSLSTRYLELINNDEQSREDRDKQYEEGIRRTGLGRDAPGGANFEGASKVVHPVLAEACVDFESRQINHLLPVSTDAVVPDLKPQTPPKEADTAYRVAGHMSWQLANQISEYRPCMEKLLSQLPLAGVGYLKLYYNEREDRPCSEFVPVDDVFLPYEADDFYTSQRVTQRCYISDIEFEARIASGMYRDLDYSEPETVEETKSQEATDKIEGKARADYEKKSVRTLLDIYVLEEFDFDTKADGLSPYVMTIDASSRKICAIRRNWEEKDEARHAIHWLIEFPFIPWRGAYPIGLSHLIGSLSGAATGSLRALLDSAHINNSQTLVTMKGSGLSGQSKRIAQGGITEIQNRAGATDIRQLMMPLPYNAPSEVLYQLLTFLIGEARGVVRTSLDTAAEDNQNMPVGTKLANIQEGMVVYSAIHARMYFSQMRALRTLHLINRIYGIKTEDIYSSPLLPIDYDDYLAPCRVRPVSDPAVFCETQKMNQLQFSLEMMEKNPELYDAREVHKWAHSLMNTPNIDKLMKPNMKPEDENPAAENVKMGMGQPATALPDQDHEAHLSTHLDFLEAPLYGMNPFLAPTLIPLAIKHTIQHLLLAYGDAVMEVIESALGADISEVLDPHPAVTTALSQSISKASQPALKAMMMEPTIERALPALIAAQKFLISITPQQAPQDPAMLLAAAEMKKAQDKEVSDKRRDELKAEELSLKNNIEEFDQTSDYKIKKDKLALDSRRLDLEEDKAALQAAHDLKPEPVKEIPNGKQAKNPAA